MGTSDTTPSECVVMTVAEALETDPIDLPPLEETISSDALDDLFHETNPLAGAYTIFPYADVWVLVHGDGTVDVFDEYVATSAGEGQPTSDERPTDDRMILVHAEGDHHTITEDSDLERLHEAVETADSCEEAWENTIDVAEGEFRTD